MHEQPEQITPSAPPTEQTSNENSQADGTFFFQSSQQSSVEPASSRDTACLDYQERITVQQACNVASKTSLPAVPGWDFHSFSRRDASLFFNQIGLPHIAQAANDTNENGTVTTRKKGWQRPGPGPKRGRRQSSRAEHLIPQLRTALLYLVKDALHHEQVYYLSDITNRSTEMLSTAQRLNALDNFEKNTPTSNTVKRKIWSLGSQLGVPGIMIKLASTPHAIALYMLPDRPYDQWWCTYCVANEVQIISQCAHTREVKKCIEEIGMKLDLSISSLNTLLVNSAAYQFMPDLNSACFYGDLKKKGMNIDIAIVRSTENDLSNGVDEGDRIHIVRKTRNAGNWICTAQCCSGLGLQSTRPCIHSNLTRTHIKQGMITPFSSLATLQHTNQQAPLQTFGNDIKLPRHSRPMIPSSKAFEVDTKIQSDAIANKTSLIVAARRCFCGRSLHETEQETPRQVPLRVETARHKVNYLQEIWTCQEGHTVLPEEDQNTREGLLWISRDTAYSEVFLFDILLHIVLGGTTVSSQADIRSQLFFLRQNYTSQDDIPRSPQSVRTALTMYAMSVVMGMEDWVFRCNKCAIAHNNGFYYDKLSFDGQQLGFKLSHDSRYDFYGKKTFTWRRPVQRSPVAWQTVHLIESQYLRQVLTEVCRVRKVPQGCTSVNALCRSMMNISLQNKHSIQAAVAAIKMLDSDWISFVAEGMSHADDSSFDSFRRTFDEEESSHPIPFITTDATDVTFARGMVYIKLFQTVLNATKAAAMISIQLVNLRSDLKEHIPTKDKAFLQIYSEHSSTILNEWLMQLTEVEPGPNFLPNTQHYLNEDIQTGIANHSAILLHPYRSSWSWKYVDHDSETGTEQKDRKQMICQVRSIRHWTCPSQPTTRILLMIMAFFNDPCCVWIRDGTFNELLAAVEVLTNAEQYCGSPNFSYHCRAALPLLKNSILLYEGVIGFIGANDTEAKDMYATIRDVMRTIPQKYDEYKSGLYNCPSPRTQTFSPKEFDDMLLWTSACDSAHTVEPNDLATSRFISDKYSNVASMLSDDFLETGVWGPDFTQRRPSPSSMTWGTDTAQAERSCSKNFDVHQSFSPGTFGAYCLCKHVKTVSVTFLKQPEGCRMPLNFIIERCLKLPRYVVYDFACGTQRAATGISARLLEHTSFVVDPFHFPGHKTCSLAMHQSSYGDLRGTNTESQEQRNKAIKVLERTLRASRDSHFMHLVVLTHGYLNLKSMFMDQTDQDPTDLDVKAWVKWMRDNRFNNTENSNA